MERGRQVLCYSIFQVDYYLYREYDTYIANDQSRLGSNDEAGTTLNIIKFVAIVQTLEYLSQLSHPSTKKLPRYARASQDIYEGVP